MQEIKPPQETLNEIKQMMERSSRFLSLSGLSGIAAGICALTGAYFAHDVIKNSGSIDGKYTYLHEAYNGDSLLDLMGSKLFSIALITLIAAFISSFIFTYLRSKKEHIALWGRTSQRLAINLMIPLSAGGFFLLKMIEHHIYGFIAPGCLIFYGLALVNASKYTLGEIRYLGYAQLLLGIINCVYIGYGIYFFAAGFGIMHIIYGAVMWWRYERKNEK